MADNAAAAVQNAGAYKRTVAGNIDWYYGGGDIAWIDKASAIAGVPLWRRSGQTLGILENNKIVEYIWHPSDLSDSGLTKKFDVISSSGGTIRGQVYLNNGTNTTPKWSADPNTGDRHDQFATGTGEEDGQYVFEWLNDLNDGTSWLFRKNDNGRYQDIFKIMQNGLQHRGKTVPVGTGTSAQFFDGTGTLRNLSDINSGVKGYTLSFGYPKADWDDFFETQGVITSILLKGATKIQYSIDDGTSFITPTLPLSQPITIKAGTWVRWLITYAPNMARVSAYIKLQ
ncbi:hypothetical protein KHS38_12175 [Mucilaginibacter sp. Bleaf8]|uniref:hypothetical protein n=1 Tax=Mucilaginibacter sp. Bleaf8 TaxID=2834430 RepID=UPI001BCAF253|nr:hypothetical protein [Mucilaginibacter sp. Bleaf8]MBS7565162.1 hypothetical protein [Mucilaginibacter sp. Bleaf8]